MFSSADRVEMLSQMKRLLTEVRALADSMLSNSVIEDVVRMIVLDPESVAARG